ncbi:MAG: SHOCT domain-containing protein [Dysgonamonadaceae bacterium]|nr:SHOCT domain-containing protein [Dysgonamonadaceae bacterium]
MHRFGEHGWGMGFGMGWWWIIGLIIIVVIIWLVVKAINQSNHTTPPYDNKSALDILEERYARGEIDKDEFDQRKKDLL